MAFTGTAFFDDMNRADNSSVVGNGWVTKIGTCGIISNAGYVSAGNGNGNGTAMSGTGAGTNNQRVEAHLGAFVTNDIVMAVFLGSDITTGTGVLFGYINTNSFAIQSMGSFDFATATTRSGTAGGTYNAGADTVALQVVNGVYTGEHPIGTPICTWDDSITNIVTRDASHRSCGWGMQGVFGRRPVDDFKILDETSSTPANLFFFA